MSWFKRKEGGAESRENKNEQKTEYKHPASGEHGGGHIRTSQERAFEGYRKKVLQENLQRPDARNPKGKAEFHNVLIPDREPLPREYEQIVSTKWEGIEKMQQQMQELERKIKEEQELANAVEQYVVLFDHPTSFSDLLHHVRLLKKAGIAEVKTERHTYSTDEMIDLIGDAEAISDEWRDRSEADIEKKLAAMGITGAKISPHTTSGFRGCLTKLIKNAPHKVRILR